MRRYRFRLEPVLRVRRLQEETAQAVVQEATAGAAAAAAVLAERERACAAATVILGTGSTAAFLHAQTHRSALATAVHEERGRRAEAEAAVEGARAVWTAAATRVGALERLNERQHAEHRAQALREDAAIIDDLVVTRYGRDPR